MATLIEKVRWMVGDNADRSRAANDPGTGGVTLTLPTGHTDKFPVPGVSIEWQDNGERALVEAVNPAAGTITIARGIDGTTATAHVANTTFFIEPRLSYAQISDTAMDVVEGDMWPHVWVPKETSFATIEADGTYSPVADDIEDVIYVYQLIDGERHRLGHDWLSPELADNTNFPRGMLSIPGTWDTSTLFVSYRAKPVLQTMPEKLVRLCALGTAAQLLMQEEGFHVAAAVSAADRRIQEGAKGRAGALLWERFVARRNEERISLFEDERQGHRIPVYLL